MRLTTILLLLGCLQVCARGGAQTISLSLKNATVEQAFTAIEKQTDYRFVYTKEDIQKASRLNIQVTNVNLTEALNLCFQGQPIMYVLNEKFIVVKNRPVKAQTLSEDGEEPSIDVKGRVLDEKNNAVEGVTVSVKGGKKSTNTDSNGDFVLAGIDPNATLIFTSVNMETFEYKVNGQTGLVVNLKAKITALGDVTITPINTGYQVLKPNEVTGSFAVVNKEQLESRVAPDIISKLEGIVPGLAFNKDANTGESKLRIRGESTIFGKADPLIVLDGFPYDGDFSNINPNDVENITILKDAAAASIWGVQAGNGVIVITTTKGKYNQRLKLNINSNLTVTEKPNLFYSPQISPSDYIDFERFLFDKQYYDGLGLFTDPTVPVISPVVEILNKQRNNQITAGEAESQLNALRKSDLRADLLKHLYQRAIHQQYSVNINGGNSKTSYFFSAGYDKDLSSIIGNNSDRITLNTQFSFNPVKNLEFKFGSIYTESKKNSNGISTLPNAYPYTKLRDGNGSWLSIPQRRSIFEDTIANHGFLDWRYYPLADRELLDNSSKALDMRLFASIKYYVLSGLTAEISYQYTNSNSRAENVTSPESYLIRNNINRFAIVSNGNFIGSNYPNGGLYDVLATNGLSQSGRALLNYNRSWDKHTILAMAGGDFREVKGQFNTSRFYGYNPETGNFINPQSFATLYPTYPLGGSAVIGGTGLSNSSSIDRFRSFYMNLAYTYMQKYTFSASTRFDGSNYFGVKANQKTVPLWSAGVKWNLTKESFYSHWKKNPDISLRITYGYNGNLDRTTAALLTLRYVGNDAVTGLPYSIVNNIPNPELRWERLSHLNIGLDFATFNNRVSGSIEYFNKTGKDLIGDAPMDPTTGIIQLRGNFAGLETKGIDIQLKAKVIDKGFNWTTNLLFSYASDKVTRYDVPNIAGKYLNAYNQIVPIVGQPLYSLSSYRWGGLDPTTGNPRGFLADTLTTDYAALTTKTLVSDLVYNGRYNPPYYGSLLNTFSFKGFKLSANIIYKLDYYFRRSSISYSALLNNWRGGHSDYSVRWQKPGDELITNVPSLVYPITAIANRDGFYNGSNILVEKGDHIRLQYINLAYTVNREMLNRLPIQNLEFYLYANNLNLILWRANDKGIDPDYPYLAYPPARTWSAGLRASF